MSNDLKWVTVKSSNIDAVAYLESNRELHIKFKSGTHYRYFDVTPGVFLNIVSGDLAAFDGSVGKFFIQTIRDLYKSERVEAQKTAPTPTNPMGQP